MGLTLYGWAGFPVYQIDALYGAGAAIMEMLVRSLPGRLAILPALPTRWRQGSITGIACRGGQRLDLTWDQDARTIDIGIQPGWMEEIELVFPCAIADFQASGTQNWERLDERSFRLSAPAPVQVRAGWAPGSAG